MGEDSQDVVNRQIGDFDLFVGVMWKRFGSPTKRAESGTEEEFERAYATYKEFGKPRIMFYFRTTPFYPKTEKELTQFRKAKIRGQTYTFDKTWNSGKRITGEKLGLNLRLTLAVDF